MIRLSRVYALLLLVNAATRAAPAHASGAATSPSAVLAANHGRNGAMAYMPPSPGDRVERGDDHTLAPYFFVAGGDPATDRLPLKETGARVHIAGPIARVEVHQVFGNDGQRPIEATYVFPASTRAAVHGMRMRIGTRVITAKIDRREDARRTYEQARQEGKRTSLLEQERPNVFTMSVANVMPGDRIEVELDYSELLVPEDAVYEFVYPTVVGPRYGGGADPARDKWIASPYLPEGSGEVAKFGLSVHLETGVPIKELGSPSHKIGASYPTPTSADVSLLEAGGGNRDFILRYRLAGDRVETGVLLAPGDANGPGGAFGHFAMVMEPPQRPTDAQIPAREFVFLLDVSGSMWGFPLDTAKALMRDLLGGLRPTDRFNLALFSGTSYVMSPEGSIAATPGNVARAIELVQRQRGGGGTELLGGLEACYRIPKGEQGVSRTVVVVTDGYVGVEARAFRFIRERLDEANLFAFGIGNAVNRGLIEGMARAGQGEPFVVLRAEKARTEAVRFREMIVSPVLTDIKVRFRGLDVLDVQPAKVPDLLARRPIVVFGRYRGTPGGVVEVSGRTGGATPFVATMNVDARSAHASNAALRWLWARKWVETLDDERHLVPSKALENAITDLGLGYGLLTAFTSFVAVDSQVVNRGGGGDSVAQPLPLPEGVSNLAVGGEATKSVGGAYGSAARGAGVLRAAPMVPPPAFRAAAPPALPTKKQKRPEAAEVLGGVVGGGGVGALGSVGYGAGGGGSGKGNGRRARAASRPGQSMHAKVALDGEGERPAEAQTAPRALIASVVPHDLGDSRALVAALEQALAKACDAKPGAEVKLRLVVDAQGKVTRVEVAGGDAALGRCVRDLFLHLTSATRPAGAAEGSLLVTLRVPRER